MFKAFGLDSSSVVVDHSRTMRRFVGSEIVTVILRLWWRVGFWWYNWQLAPNNNETFSYVIVFSFRKRDKSYENRFLTCFNPLIHTISSPGTRAYASGWPRFLILQQLPCIHIYVPFIQVAEGGGFLRRFQGQFSVCGGWFLSLQRVILLFVSAAEGSALCYSDL